MKSQMRQSKNWARTIGNKWMLDIELEILVCCARDKSSKYWEKFLGQKLIIAQKKDGKTSRERWTKAVKRIAKRHQNKRKPKEKGPRG